MPRGLRCAQELDIDYDVDRLQASMQVAPQAAQCVAVVPSANESPYNGASWGDVFSLMQERLAWEDMGLSMQVFDQDKITADKAARQAFDTACKDSQMLVAVGVQQPDAAQAVQDACQSSRWPVVLALDSAEVRVL